MKKTDYTEVEDFVLGPLYFKQPGEQVENNKHYMEMYLNKIETDRFEAKLQKKINSQRSNSTQNQELSSRNFGESKAAAIKGDSRMISGKNYFKNKPVAGSEVKDLSEVAPN
jgi:hypothetical protein